MVQSSREALEAQVEAIAAGPVAEHGATIYDVEVHLGSGSGIVRLTVDRPGEGINIGEITAIARQVGYLLDVEDLIPARYNFEVSSPGVERTLRLEKHYASAIGQEVRIVLRNDLEGVGRVVEGRLDACADGRAQVSLPDGELVSVELTKVRRARTVFNFGTPQEK